MIIIAATGLDFPLVDSQYVASLYAVEDAGRS